MILVLDHYTAHLLINYKIDMCELFKRNVLQVEDLVKKRKRYPMTDVIYFIQPDEESIEKLIEDFPKEDELPYD